MPPPADEIEKWRTLRTKQLFSSCTRIETPCEHTVYDLDQMIEVNLAKQLFRQAMTQCLFDLA
jgi:hypothetical protein